MRILEGKDSCGVPRHDKSEVIVCLLDIGTLKQLYLPHAHDRVGTRRSASGSVSGVDALQSVHTVQFFPAPWNFRASNSHRLSPFPRKGRSSYLSTSPQVIRAMSVEMARILASTLGSEHHSHQLES